MNRRDFLGAAAAVTALAAPARIRFRHNPGSFIRDFEDLARAIRTGSETRYYCDHELLVQETLLRASGEIG